MIARIILLWVVVAAAMAGLLFGSAGRWDIPAFWLLLGIWFAFGSLAWLTMDRDLMKERMKPGPGGRDNVGAIRAVSAIAFVCHLTLAGLDAGRFHWSVIPGWVQGAGIAGYLATLSIIYWSMRTNRFFSSAVRIQSDRGHHVIDSGPYRYVRHPAYAALTLMPILSGIALGSWWAILPTAALIVVFLRRTALEDRMLRSELDGYAEYAGQVRYRLLPGVW